MGNLTMENLTVGLLVSILALILSFVVFSVRTLWRLENKIDDTNNKIDTTARELRRESQAAHSSIESNINRVDANVKDSEARVNNNINRVEDNINNRFNDFKDFLLPAGRPGSPSVRGQDRP